MPAMNPLERVFVNALKGYWNRAVVRYLLKRTPIPPGQRMLELGCGRGSIIPMVRERLQPRLFVATDLDGGQLRRAEKEVDRRWVATPTDIALAQADAHRLPFREGTFDVVILFAVLHHVEDWRRVLDECFRVLAPGGRIIVEEYLHKLDIRRYLAAQARMVLDKGLAKVVCLLVAEKQPGPAPQGA